jgi:hypothetical protein
MHLFMAAGDMWSSKAFVYSAVLVWSAAVVSGYLWITNYGFATYQPADHLTQSNWPLDSRLMLAAERPTLVLFLHPKCPCTRATIRELDRILTGHGLTSQRLPKFIAVASLPVAAPEDWHHTDTIMYALQLPNSSIVWDINGIESSRFGAVTSGTVMVYLPNGKRVFAGGVTASRGHEGDNTGSDLVLAALTEDDHVAKASTPAFGCRLCIAESKGTSSTSVVPGAVLLEKEASCRGASP